MFGDVAVRAATGAMHEIGVVGQSRLRRSASSSSFDEDATQDSTQHNGGHVVAANGVNATGIAPTHFYASPNKPPTQNRCFAENAHSRFFGENPQNRWVGENAQNRWVGENAQNRAFGEYSQSRCIAENRKNSQSRDVDNLIEALDQTLNFAQHAATHSAHVTATANEPSGRHSGAPPAPQTTQPTAPAQSTQPPVSAPSIPAQPSAPSIPAPAGTSNADARLRAPQKVATKCAERGQPAYRVPQSQARVRDLPDDAREKVFYARASPVPFSASGNADNLDVKLLNTGESFVGALEDDEKGPIGRFYFNHIDITHHELSRRFK